MNKVVFPQTYDTVSLGKLIARHPNVTFFSTCFCLGAACWLVSTFLFRYAKLLLTQGEQVFSQSILIGLILVILGWLLFTSLSQWIISSFDLLLVTIFSFQMAVSLLHTIFSKNPILSETFTIPGAGQEPFTLHAITLLSMFSAILRLLIKGYFKEVLVCGLLLVSIRFVLLSLYTFFATMIEAWLLYHAPERWIAGINLIRGIRTSFFSLDDRRYERAYTRYFLEYWVHVRERRGATKFDANRTTRRTERIIECPYCGTQNRVPGKGPQKQQRCRHCGLFMPIEEQAQQKKSKEPEKTIGREERLQKYCAILGIEPTTDEEVIRKAYYQIIRKYHPDLFVGLGEEFVKLAHARTVEITAAYEQLKKLLNSE